LVDLKSSARVTAQYAAPQVKVSKMKIERLFRVAPSIVRMILKERLTATYVVEGYLQSTPERAQLVRLEPSGCHLLLQRLGDQERTEERTKLPTEQAEALLDVSGGRVGYRRTLVRVDNERDANLDRFEQPAGLDLVTVEFDDERQAADFSVPAWFGPEVTNEDHFRKSTLAVAGAPTIEEVEVNNAAVIALVEALESAPRLKSRSTANLGVASLSASDDADRTQPVRLPPVLRLPLPAKLPEVGVAELDPRVTEVLDGVAKALEHAPTQQHGVSAETHVDIRRAS
jgi:CYTH domain-containing protein